MIVALTLPCAAGAYNFQGLSGEEDNMKIGLHASHEQFAPSHLLDLAVMGRDAGFESLLSSDHFHPWSVKQGNSGLSWAWLGAAMAATNLPAGVVCAPGQRWNPAIIAQAASTLEEMFPQRFFLAVGSGQLLNEGITGGHWPVKHERQDRLKECVDIIRALWKGETVTHHGRVCVEDATLYTRPGSALMIFGAAITAQSARWVAQWADGLITISGPRSRMREVVNAFRDGGGEAKPMILKVQLSYAPDRSEALDGAIDQWRAPCFDSSVLAMLRTPQQFDMAAEEVSAETIERNIRISADLSEHVDWLVEDARMGFSRAILHNVNRQQERFIEAFGVGVLPQVKGGGA